MNETMDPSASAPPPPPQPDQDRGPTRERFRSLADAQRSTDDRLLAGVSAGIGRHLGIDPVIVRVVFVALVFVSLAGPILYATAWFLLPSDDGRRSIAADWFRLDANERQFRTAGLLIGAAVALAAAIGDRAIWWGSGPWPLFVFGLPALFLYWLIVVLPRRSRTGSSPRPAAPPHDARWAPAETVQAPETVQFRSGAGPAEGVSMPAGEPSPQQAGWNPAPPRPRRRLRPPLLLLATVSAITAVLGGLALLDFGFGVQVAWTTYIVAALLTTGAGMIVGAWRGRSYLLVLVGLALSMVLAVGSMMPNGQVADVNEIPASAAEVKSTYQLGAGVLEVDLRQLSDPESLKGRTITLETGYGETRVHVPQDLPVSIDASVSVGWVDVFGTIDDGRSARVNSPNPDDDALTILIDQSFGQITVDRS